MAYKALYRIYRPDGFNQMVGQKHIVKTLQNAVERNQIAHAYLFCGPRGTGKTSTAKIFAKAINCEAENRPCGICDNCKEALTGAHPDIIEIDAASNNGVEEARNLIEKVKYAPLKGKYKVYIIDEVHMMSTSAFNALLKTIEEPPAHVIFILATTEPHKVISTIISRCQRFDFAKISRSEIIDRLTYITQKEGIKTDRKVLESIAILSDGGMRDALSILDQCRAYSPEEITIHDVNEIYGVVSIQELCNLFEYAKYKKSESLIKKIEEYDRTGVDIKRLTTDLIDVLKESVIYDYSKDVSMLNNLNEEQVHKCKENTSTKQRLDMIDVLMVTYERYYQASNVSSYFEIGMLKIMNMMEDNLVESLPKLNAYQEEVTTPIIKEEKIEEQDETGFKEEVEETAEEKVVASDEEEITEAIPALLVDESMLINTLEEIEEQTIEEISIPYEQGINTFMEEVKEEPLHQEEMISQIPEQKEVIIQEEMQVQEPELIQNEVILEQREEKAANVEPVLQMKISGLDDTFLLGLLVGANKPEKSRDRQQMLNILSFTLDSEYAKYANLLKSSNIVASAETYILIHVESQVLANEINDLDKNCDFAKFTEVLLEKSKKVFCITNDKMEELILLFKEKSAENALPEPAQIHIENKRVVVIEDEQINTIKSLFENVVIKED